MTADTPARQPQQEIHDQIGKLKTDLFKCIGTIESIQSKCRDTHTSPPAPARLACVIDLHAYQHGNTLFEDIRACSGVSCNYCGRYTETCEFWKSDAGGKQLCAKPIISVELFEASVKIAEAEAAKAAREQVLDDLGTMLNSRIAKMEIICSKSKTPLREGILMAYREIEGWEMQQRKSLRAHQEPQS